MDLNGLNRCSASRTQADPSRPNRDRQPPNSLTRRLVDFFLTSNFSLMVRNSGVAGWNRRANRL